MSAVAGAELDPLTGSPLRILHLFANFKWTGPADPAIRCAHHLRELGADVLFAQARWMLPDAEHWMRPVLRRWRLPVTYDLELRKHFHVPSLLRDGRTLRARLQRGDFDVLHCHLLGDHSIAAIANRGLDRRVTVVRSLYDPEPPKKSWRNRLAFRATDGIVAPTASCARAAARRFGFAETRVLHQEPPVEPRPEADRDLRADWGLGPEHVVVGITARIQPHRRFELLWQTARRVVDAAPRARFVLLGRGNARDTEELVRRPLRELDLEQHVLTPGYLGEPEYGRALRTLDVFMFLVPGSDGTCRAVREAMSCGLPVVATRRGMLEELVADGGVNCEETAPALAAALNSLIADPEHRARVGNASRRRAEEQMNPRRAAERLLAFYRQLRGGAR